nr:hypothetical protein SYMBAF_20073 [Serratia symbiotica]
MKIIMGCISLSHGDITEIIKKRKVILHTKPQWQEVARKEHARNYAAAESRSHGSRRYTLPK